jgi:hypothetical protein
MPETPPLARGLHYNTHLTQRCHNFHQCKRCAQCTHYNKHDLMCLECECRKPRGMHCQCTDEQQAQVIFLEELLGKPMWHPDQLASNVVHQEGHSTAFDDDPTAQLVKRMADQIEQSG